MNRRSAIWIWLALVTPALLATLHVSALAPLVRQSVTLAFQPHEGHAYRAEFPRTHPWFFEPDIRVFEDGRALPFPALPLRDTVVRDGAGRFHIEPGLIFLSASDNSDPRSNGRVYTLSQPWALPRAAIVVWPIALLATIWIAVARRRELIAWNRRAGFSSAAILLLTLVAASRAWFFLDYPIAGIYPDSGTYYRVAEQIGVGAWPNFGNRPPIYPLFLRMIYAIDDRAIAVAAAQTMLSILGGLLLVYAVYCWRPALGLAAGAVVGMFLCGYYPFEYDTAILSESVYTSGLTIAFGSLLVGLRRSDRRWLTLSSSAMALAILTRPAGMFLVGTYLIVGTFLFWRRRPAALKAAFLAPFPVLLLLMSAYNYRVVGVFAPTTWGEANFAVATQLSWQTDPAYPPPINEAITRIHDIIYERMARLGKDPAVLETSWDPDVLGPVFLESFNITALDIALTMGGRYETGSRAWIRRIGIDAIRKRPMRYVKFVYAMLRLYFRPSGDYDFRSKMQSLAETYYVQRSFSASRGDALVTRLGKEFADASAPPGVVIMNNDPAARIEPSERIVVEPTTLWRIYDVTLRLRKLIFQLQIWPIALAVGLVASALLVVRTRARHDAAFALFIVAISAVGASLVVSLVEYSQPRYSYPMEWTYGVAVVLLPLLWINAAPPAAADAQ